MLVRVLLEMSGMVKCFFYVGNDCRMPYIVTCPEGAWTRICHIMLTTNYTMHDHTQWRPGLHCMF